jgi:hypothetical protein
VQLADILCDDVSLPHGSTAADLISWTRTNGSDFLDGILETDDSRAAAETWLTTSNGLTAQVARRTASTHQQVCEVQISGIGTPVWIALFPSDQIAAPSTLMESMIFWAAVHPGLDWHTKRTQRANGACIDWRGAAQGNALLAVPPGIQQRQLRALAAAFGFEHADLSIPGVAPAILTSETAILIEEDSTCMEGMGARLLADAQSSVHPKWRCLSLYRILEYRYLEIIKRQLLDAFDKDPKAAVDTATERLSSELQQLKSLADSLLLQPDFEVFNTSFQSLVDGHNQFAMALDRSARSHEFNKSPDLYVKGVLRLYRLRCSIAHAGTSSVFYEKLKDADLAAQALIPAIERIALKALGIRKV